MIPAIPPKNNNPKVHRYLPEILFLKMSIIKTTAVIKLQNNAMYIKKFPATGGMPRLVRSKLIVKIENKAPKRARKKSGFSGMSRLNFMLILSSNIKKFLREKSTWNCIFFNENYDGQVFLQAG